jgi:hypothetical protein
MAALGRRSRLVENLDQIERIDWSGQKVSASVISKATEEK